MQNEELLSRYLLAQRDIDKAVDNFSDEETIFKLMEIAENYKKEILRRMENGRRE